MSTEPQPPAPWMTPKGLWVARVFAVAWDGAARQSLIFRMMSPAERREYVARARPERAQYKPDGTRPFWVVRFTARWASTLGAAFVLVRGAVTAAHTWITQSPSAARASSISGDLLAAAVLGGIFAMIAVPLWVLERVRPSFQPDPWRCRRCLYDLRGITAGARCPECGTAP